MAVGAYRRRRIAIADQGAVNTAFPLRERVGMTAAARLGRADRVAARAFDIFFAGWMGCRVDIGMTAGASVWAVNGLGKRRRWHMQKQRFAVRQLLLHAGGAVAAKAVLVRCCERFIGCERRRGHGRHKSKRCDKGGYCEFVAEERVRDAVAVHVALAPSVSTAFGGLTAPGALASLVFNAALRRPLH